MEPLLAHLVHEFAQKRHVETILRLDELRPRRDLLGDVDRPVLVGRRERIGGGAQEHPRRRGQLAGENRFEISEQIYSRESDDYC